MTPGCRLRLAWGGDGEGELSSAALGRGYAGTPIRQSSTASAYTAEVSLGFVGGAGSNSDSTRTC